MGWFILMMDFNEIGDLWICWHLRVRTCIVDSLFDFETVQKFTLVNRRNVQEAKEVTEV